jgi:hypothetical protein
VPVLEGVGLLLMKFFQNTQDLCFPKERGGGQKNRKPQAVSVSKGEKQTEVEQVWRGELAPEAAPPVEVQRLWYA